VECGSLHDRPECFRYKGQSQLYTAFKIFATLKYTSQASRIQESGGLASLSGGSVTTYQICVLTYLANIVHPSPPPRNKSGNVKKISPPPTHAVKVHIRV